MPNLFATSANSIRTKRALALLPVLITTTFTYPPSLVYAQSSSNATQSQSGVPTTHSVATAGGQAKGMSIHSKAGSSASSGSAESSPKILKGNVSQTAYPFIEGKTEVVPQGTKLGLNLSANLNSELAKVGDEIWAEVSTDLKEGETVVLPGKWRVKGHVTRVERQKRMGRDGYVEVKFDQLVSPDGEYTVPLDAKATTKESTGKTIAKQVVTTTGYTTVGAIGGALASVQMTGIGVAIASYGISVGIGGGVGAAIGVAAALHRKGNIQSNLAGEEIEINLPSDITLPAFKQDVIPSKAPKPKLDNVDFVIKDLRFGPGPFGDKKSKLLSVKFLVENHSNRSYDFADIALKSDHNQNCFPYALSDLKEAHKKVGPNALQEATITFQVTSDKHKYWLVLLDRSHINILSQVAIN